MISILVYRSRLVRKLTEHELSSLVEAAAKRNAENGITGILLFDNLYFFQYLEGPEQALQSVYELIARDPRHRHLVRLLHDYAPSRRFSNWSMQLINVQNATEKDVDAFLTSGLTTALPDHDRAYKLIQAFASSRWKDHASEFDSNQWNFNIARSNPLGVEPLDTSLPCQFALQPIVSPLDTKISSFEALIRSSNGGSPKECFDQVPAGEQHLFDLKSKRYALSLASRLDIGQSKLSINLLPMSLVRIPQGVDQLLGYIKESGLTPEQVIVEITEEEAISHFDDFAQAMKALRSVGISVSIDDFGAGFAGLSLLSKFQPEKLKIDRLIVTSIHEDGPKQAIVRAIIECCKSLGITIVAEGVETPEEWGWLQAAGVDLFQGFLFAKPLINGMPAINWPSNVNTVQKQD